MMIVRAVLALFLPLLSAACAVQRADSPAACALVKKAEFPVTFYHNRPFVLAVLDGFPVNLLVDTGASNTIVSKSVQDRIGLPQGYGEQYLLMGIGGQARSKGLLARQFRLGASELGAHVVQGLPFDIRETNRQVTEGIVGMDVLSGYDLDLDLPHHRVALYERRNCPSGKPDWGDAASTEFPGSLDTSQRMHIHVDLDGHDVIARIDSGASTSAVDVQIAQLIGITPAQLGTDRKIASSGIGEATQDAWVHTFSALAVGPSRSAPAILTIIRLPIGENMLLGEDFLRRHRVWMANYTQQVFVGPDVGR